MAKGISGDAGAGRRNLYQEIGFESMDCTIDAGSGAKPRGRTLPQPVEKPENGQGNCRDSLARANQTLARRDKLLRIFRALADKLSYLEPLVALLERSQDPGRQSCESGQNSSNNQKNILSYSSLMSTPEDFMPYNSAASREVRRIRILAAMLNGANYAEIAAIENISRERVRQIVVESLKNNDREREDHRRVQAARLEPALKLALDAIEEGRIEAIERLLRVLGAQDKYLAQIPTSQAREDVRRRLIAKLEAASRPPDPRAQNKPAFAAAPMRGGEPAAADLMALLEAEEARAARQEAAQPPEADSDSGAAPL